jgi:phosphomethylpyrimidine synthase
MFTLSLDPVKAKAVRCLTEDRDRDVCTMCGEFCAIKTYGRFEEVRRVPGADPRKP